MTSVQTRVGRYVGELGSLSHRGFAQAACLAVLLVLCWIAQQPFQSISHGLIHGTIYLRSE